LSFRKAVRDQKACLKATRKEPGCKRRFIVCRHVTSKSAREKQDNFRDSGKRASHTASWRRASSVLRESRKNSPLRHQESADDTLPGVTADDATYSKNRSRTFSETR
jgi:hypothetical protein